MTIIITSKNILIKFQNHYQKYSHLIHFGLRSNERPAPAKFRTGACASSYFLFFLTRCDSAFYFVCLTVAGILFAPPSFFISSNAIFLSASMPANFFRSLSNSSPSHTLLVHSPFDDLLLRTDHAFF